MTGRKTWKAGYHDLVLADMHGRGMTDLEIGRSLGFDFTTVAKHRERLELPANAKGRPAATQTETAPPPYRGKPNPIDTARLWLGTRLAERDGGFWLDGLPTRLDAVIRETNRLLKAAGMETLRGSPAWEVG